MSLYNDDATKYFWKSTFPKLGQFLVEFLLCAFTGRNFRKCTFLWGRRGLELGDWAAVFN